MVKHLAQRDAGSNPAVPICAVTEYVYVRLARYLMRRSHDGWQISCKVKILTRAIRIVQFYLVDRGLVRRGTVRVREMSR